MRSNATVRRLSPGLALAILPLLIVGCLQVNDPPVAAFERTPESGEAPLGVYFDASASLDPEGEALAYDWTFGDGASAVGVSATHTYAAAGTYEVRLTVSDPQGASSDSVRMVVVTDPAVEPPSGNQVGSQAIDFTLDDLNGTALSLSDYRGLVVLLDFWASTCTPCTLTMPHLESLRATYADQGLVVIGVSIDDSEDAARSYIETNGYNDFIILYSSESEARSVKSAYGVDGVPHTFVIDRQGIIRHHDHPIRLRSYHIEPWL